MQACFFFSPFPLDQFLEEARRPGFELRWAVGGNFSDGPHGSGFPVSRSIRRLSSLSIRTWLSFSGDNISQ